MCHHPPGYYVVSGRALNEDTKTKPAQEPQNGGREWNFTPKRMGKVLTALTNERASCEEQK